MVHKKGITFLSSIMFILVLLWLLLVISQMVERKNCINEYLPYFKEEGTFDVLFFGSSHVACDISPMELWKDYGITSYNFGNSDEPLSVAYWTMQMALEYKTPKLVVVDVLGWGRDVKYVDDTMNSTHNSWDCFPLTKIKIQAVTDLIEDNKIRLEYLFDIGKYHTRWNELTVNDFVAAPSRDKGVWAYGSVEGITVALPQVQNEITYVKADLDENVAGMKYLRKMIELCQSRNIQVLLVLNPYVCSVEDQMQANAIQDVAGEYGVGYINFVQMNRVIDYNVDMMDAGHTNPSGMQKITDFLGRYMLLHYEFEDHRNDENYASWWVDYDDFTNLKVETFVSREDVTSVLELLHDKNFSCIITIRPNTDVLNVPNIQNLLQNIVRTHIYDDTDIQITSAEMMPLSRLYEASVQRFGYTLLVNNTDGTFAERVGFEEGDSETSDIHVSVIDNRSLQIISDMRWNYSSAQTMVKVQGP